MIPIQPLLHLSVDIGNKLRNAGIVVSLKARAQIDANVPLRPVLRNLNMAQKPCVLLRSSTPAFVFAKFLFSAGRNAVIRFIVTRSKLPLQKRLTLADLYFLQKQKHLLDSLCSEIHVFLLYS